MSEQLVLFLLLWSPVLLGLLLLVEDDPPMLSDVRDEDDGGQHG